MAVVPRVLHNYPALLDGPGQEAPDRGLTGGGALGQQSGSGLRPLAFGVGEISQHGQQAPQLVVLGAVDGHQMQSRPTHVAG
jgi:hypothetical protein